MQSYRESFPQHNLFETKQKLDYIYYILYDYNVTKCS